MKYFLLVAALLAIPACGGIKRISPMSSATPIQMSDLYAREAVKTYETYPASLAGHRFALVHLKSGESFPMLCQETPKGIYPIAQRVMSNAAYDKWTITAQPGGSEAKLLTYKLSAHDGGFYVGNDVLAKAPKAPALIEKPVQP